ncbi:MAG: hypothetical protein Q8784_00305 [Vigna little leaf phytoplasma]|nr:hypothetical protein [Vigna little leaf phytoplasma]
MIIWFIYKIKVQSIVLEPQILEDGTIIEFKEVNQQIIKVVNNPVNYQIEEYDVKTNQLQKIIDFKGEIREFDVQNGNLKRIITSAYDANLFNQPKTKISLQEIWPHKTVIYHYFETAKPFIEKNSSNEIILKYDHLNTNSFQEITLKDNTKIEYNEKNGNIFKISWPNGIIREYNMHNCLLTEERLPNNNLKKYHYSESEKDNHVTNKNKPFMTEFTSDGIIKKYQLCLQQEIFSNGIIRNYYANFFQDISPKDNILKEYDFYTRKLIKIFFPNNYIREYCLANGHLLKEIFPNGLIKLYNPFYDYLFEEKEPDGTRKQYDSQTHILNQIIDPNGTIVEAIQKSVPNNPQLIEITLPDKTIIEFNKEKGWVTKEITPQGIEKTTIFEYYPEEKKIKRIFFPNNYIKEFDQNECLSKEIFSDGSVREYDIYTNLLKKEILPNGIEIIYEYIPQTNHILRSIYSNGLVIEHDLNFFSQKDK